MFPFSLLSWYLVKGPRLLIFAWKNILRYLVRRFNFAELSSTLISPWKRDISPKDWVGLEIGKTLNRLLMNVFSRVMGLIVRVGVLAFGAAVLSLAVVVGVLAVPGWFLGIPIFLWLSASLVLYGRLGTAESIAVLVAAPSVLFPLFIVLFRG
ncbi:MAG: hypothetical protein HGA16_01905, partial [Candidatus Moranbacteria bacterium]|nr:hypothetical protein [Candidatus Moranbacteria bacterium]